MEKYFQQEDQVVFGIKVETFPIGIKEAFGSLMNIFGTNRSYYGISWMTEDGSISYFAMAAELPGDESKQYNFEKLTIGKGEYLTITVLNWLSNTDCIKDVFHELMADNYPGINNPCIEWYKSDDELLCMVRIV